MPNLRLSRVHSASDSECSDASLTPLLYGSIPPPDSPSLLSASLPGNATAVVEKPSFAKTFVLSVVFVIAGVAEVCINRWLLWRKDFHFPLATALSADLYAILALAAGSAMGVWTYKSGQGRGWKSLVMMLGILSCVNHALDMYGLMLLPATIVKTIRTSKPLFAAALMYLVHDVRQSRSKILSLLVVAAGAAMLTFKNDMGFNPVGSACVLTATVVSATHFVLAATVMRENSLSPISLMFLVSVVSSVLIFPFFLVKEGRDTFEFVRYDREYVALSCLALGGTCKFLHSALAWMLISRSDPIYCTLLMCIKLPVVVIVTVPMFGEFHKYGMMGWAGVGIAIAGFALFQYLDYKEYVARLQWVRANTIPSFYYTKESPSFSLMFSHRKSNEDVAPSLLLDRRIDDDRPTRRNEVV